MDMLDTLPPSLSISAPTVAPAAIVGNTPETAAFSALLGAVEQAVAVEVPAAPALDALPVTDGKIGKGPGKILPGLPSGPVEETDGEGAVPDAIPLAEQVALAPVIIPLPIALPVSVPMTIGPEAAPISDKAASPAPTVTAAQHLPTPAVLLNTAAPLPVALHAMPHIMPHMAPIPVLAAPHVLRVQDGETDPAQPMPAVSAMLLGRGQLVPSPDAPVVPSVSAPRAIAPAAPEPAPSSSPPLKADSKTPTDTSRLAAHIAAPAPGAAPSPKPAAEPPQTNTPPPNATPLGQDRIAAPLVTMGAATGAAAIEAPAPLHTAATTTEAPQDFATLVGKLTEAREAAGPQPVRTVLRHGEFGPVALEFRHEDRGLSVSMASGTPGFNGTVLAAVTATLAGGQAGSQTGDPPRNGGQQSQQQGAPSTGSGSGQSPDQRQTASTDPRASQDHPSGRRQGAQQGRQPGNEGPPRSLASDSGRSGIYA
ncbi:MAG: hypothetical protein J7530_01190 [Novosphingobium sp.]|nr:hypothetical protein [Novosphingobium sp.]